MRFIQNSRKSIHCCTFVKLQKKLKRNRKKHTEYHTVFNSILTYHRIFLERIFNIYLFSFNTLHTHKWHFNFQPFDFDYFVHLSLLVCIVSTEIKKFLFSSFSTLFRCFLKTNFQWVSIQFFLLLILIINKIRFLILSIVVFRNLWSGFWGKEKTDWDSIFFEIFGDKLLF